MPFLRNNQLPQLTPHLNRNPNFACLGCHKSRFFFCLERPHLFRNESGVFTIT